MIPTYSQSAATAMHRISIPEAPITEKYKAHIPPDGCLLQNSGVVRTTYAPTSDAPNGTVKDGWAEKHQHQTVSHYVLAAQLAC